MAAEWYNEQPKNRNFLIPVGFKLDLEIFHGVDFFCQSASIPEISIPFAEVDTPYRKVPIAGSGGINFGDLSVRFLIDEELKNYNEICSEKRGELKAELKSAKNLTQDEISKITQELSNNFKSEIKLNYIHDQSLIGGLVVQIGSTMIDTSIKKNYNN